MKTLSLISAALVALLPSSQSRAEAAFRDFITARGSQLMEGDKPFRFISFNIPNLTYTEDDMRFGQLSGFRLPTAFEIDDALASIQQIGGRVARTYVLSVHKTNDPPDLPRHILGTATRYGGGAAVIVPSNSKLIVQFGPGAVQCGLGHSPGGSCAFLFQ
jgi:hypothetical protein